MSSSNLTLDEIIILAKESFNFQNIQIVNYCLQPFSKETLGYMSVHELLTIIARDGDVLDSEEKTVTFFLKRILPDCTDSLRKVFNREPQFFHDVVPRLLEYYEGEAWAPKCYLARSDILVLEDLRSQEFQMITDGFNEKHMKALVMSLANFHASSLLLEDKLEKSLDEIFPELSQEMMFTNDNSLSWKWLSCGIEIAEAIACKLNLDPKHIRQAYELTLEATRTKREDKNVFSHSDLWCNNIMFDKQGENCRFIDFQLMSYKSYSIDLLEILHLNFPLSIRKECEKDLIILYHKTLQQRLERNNYKGEFVTLEKIFQDIETNRICGLVAAVQIFPLALLNKKLATEFVKDSETRMKHMYDSRKDFVLRACKEDEEYERRIVESIEECVNFVRNSTVTKT